MPHYSAYVSQSTEFVRERVMSDKFAELKKLAQAATPGPWLNNNHYECVQTHNNKTPLAAVCRPGNTKNGVADFEFIAAANPAAVLELIDRYAALLSAARLTVRRMGDTGDAISINALNKAIEGCN